MLAVCFLIIFISAGISIAAANVFNDYSVEQNYTRAAYRFVTFLRVSHSHCRFCVSFAAGIRKRKSCGKAIEKSGIGFQTRDPIFFHINIIIIEKWRKEKCKETLNSTGIDSHQRI